MSPICFNLIMNMILWQLDPEEKRWGPLAYADDVALVESSLEDLVARVAEYNQWCSRCNLKINPKKSAVMTVNGQRPFGPLVTAVGPMQVLGPTESYKYLGIWINSQWDWGQEREKVEEKVLARCQWLKKRKLGLSQKVYVANVAIIPVITYASVAIHWETQVLDRWEQMIMDAVTARVSGRVTNTVKLGLWTAAAEGGAGLLRLTQATRAMELANVGRLQMRAEWRQDLDILWLKDNQGSEAQGSIWHMWQYPRRWEGSGLHIETRAGGTQFWSEIVKGKVGLQLEELQANGGVSSPWEWFQGNKKGTRGWKVRRSELERIVSRMGGEVFTVEEPTFIVRPKWRFGDREQRPISQEARCLRPGERMVFTDGSVKVIGGEFRGGAAVYVGVGEPLTRT